MRSPDAERRGAGSADVQSMRKLGGSFGVAALGIVLTPTYRGHLRLDGGLPSELIEGATDPPSYGGVVAREVGPIVPGLFDQIEDGFVAGIKQFSGGMCVSSVDCGRRCSQGFPWPRSRIGGVR